MLRDSLASADRLYMIEQRFDVPFVASLALREKQIQQNYRPVIAVHKWFARRPGTLFRSLLLAEFDDRPLAQTYYEAHDLPGVRIADPFMGGGTPLIEANRLGCDVLGFDINPMSYWIVRQEIEHLDLVRYRAAADTLRRDLESRIGDLYRTRCVRCGSPEAHAKYFLWVKVQACRTCGTPVDLFPGYQVAKDARHPLHVLVCAHCGELNEVTDARAPGGCHACGRPLAASGPARRNRCPCPNCGSVNRYPDPELGTPGHRLFALEYHCPDCRPSHKGRFFKKPDADDLTRVSRAREILASTTPRYVPDDPILPGDESDRLHRWGYAHYRELFNPRQLLGLELSARKIMETGEERVRNALATNLSDLLRYQNLLCRYDTMALKSLDIFSVHGFPVGLIACESNLLGIADPRKGVVGSGGWLNIVEKFFKAKQYCDAPFEIRHEGRRKRVVPVVGEWIGDRRNGEAADDRRSVDLSARDAARLALPAQSLDAVFTDPPYFGNVQYAELMDFCYVWLRRLVGEKDAAFALDSTRNAAELTVNENMQRGLTHFAEGISAVMQNMARALKPGAPFAFTYHHNQLSAYFPVALGMLDAGLVCSATLPCPAEMGASIHINGTASSIVDTVFVCRSTGRVPRARLAETEQDLAALVRRDLETLRQGGVKPSVGDARCITFGHLIRMAVWKLRLRWPCEWPTADRLVLLGETVAGLGAVGRIEAMVHGDAPAGRQMDLALAEPPGTYGVAEYVAF